jgi:hypothetical protein
MKKRNSVVLAAVLCLLAVPNVYSQAEKGPGVGQRDVEPGPFIPSGGPYCDQPGAAIPDNTPGGVSSAQAITDTGTLTDLDVSLNVTHTWVGDLAVTLAHSGGATATILNQPGEPASTFGCSNDDIAGGIDDEGGTNLETHCAGTTPWINFLGVGGDPAGPVMSAWDGEDFSGTWTLTISDNAGGDTGTLNEWCLLPSGAIVPVELQTFSIED